jgi:ribosome-associated toxin RatA of RatAB toxin-antitoxin module
MVTLLTTNTTTTNTVPTDAEIIWQQIRQVENYGQYLEFCKEQPTLHSNKYQQTLRNIMKTKSG